MIQATGRQCAEVAANNIHTERVTAQHVSTPLPSRLAGIIDGELMQQGKTMYPWEMTVSIAAEGTLLLDSTRCGSVRGVVNKRHAIIATASSSIKDKSSLGTNTIGSSAGRDDGRPGTIL